MSTKTLAISAWPRMSTKEVTNNYSIRIIEDIHDPDLVRHWKRIAEETDCFPQMYYEWCEPWWRLQSGNRKLHVVAIEDENGRIVAIAPLCVERRFRLSVLRSFPVHFGDYYSFLAQRGEEEPVLRADLVAYLREFRTHSVVHLANVDSRSPLWTALHEEEFVAEKVCDVLVARFEEVTYQQFMLTLSAKRRSEYRRRLRRLQETGNVTVEWIQDAEGYVAHLDEMKRLYAVRWADDHSLAPDDTYNQCRTETVTHCFRSGKMALFLLKCNDRILAFRLGFLHKQGFYDWKECHDPSANRYAPSTMLVGLIIESLITSGYGRLDFMAGEYQHKRDWVSGDQQQANYDFFACKRSIPAVFYIKYRLQWRPVLRRFYHRLLDIRCVRSARRWSQAVLRRGHA